MPYNYCLIIYYLSLSKSSMITVRKWEINPNSVSNHLTKKPELDATTTWTNFSVFEALTAQSKKARSKILPSGCDNKYLLKQMSYYDHHDYNYEINLIMRVKVWNRSKYYYEYYELILWLLHTIYYYHQEK